MLGGQRHDPATLPPGKKYPVLNAQEARWAPVLYSTKLLLWGIQRDLSIKLFLVLYTHNNTRSGPWPPRQFAPIYPCPCSLPPCSYIRLQRGVPPHVVFPYPMTPNDPYMGRTAPLTSKRCFLYIYSTNKGIEYFKHALYSPFFFSSKCSLFHNANLFGSYIIHILYTGCAKI